MEPREPRPTVAVHIYEVDPPLRLRVTKVEPSPETKRRGPYYYFDIGGVAYYSDFGHMAALADALSEYVAAERGTLADPGAITVVSEPTVAEREAMRDGTWTEDYPDKTMVRAGVAPKVVA